MFHGDLLCCTALHLQQWFFQLLLVCPVTQVCRWNTYISPDKNIWIHTVMNPLEVRVTAKIFNSSWAMKPDSCYPLCFSSHLTTKQTLNVNYPQEMTSVDWFSSYLSNSWGFVPESLIILSNLCFNGWWKLLC